MATVGVKGFIVTYLITNQATVKFINLEYDDDDAERTDVAGESEDLDLLWDDRPSSRQELDQHDHWAVEVHVGVI